MRTTHYRLNEYKIIECDSGDLSWEVHFGVGALREGRCYKKGSILFLGPAENERLGYLMLEYTDHLKKLPDWTKTDYYCTSIEVFHCDTGRSVSKEEMNLWKYDVCRKGILFLDLDPIDLSNISALKTPGDSAFRLHRYEIIEKENGRINWHSCSGAVDGKIGVCSLLEDILFIGPLLITQTSLDKHQFSAQLKQLPKWKETKYFCPKYVLHECNAKHENHVEKTMGEKKKTDAVKEFVQRDSGNGAESGMPHNMQKTLTEKITAAVHSPFGAEADPEFFQSGRSYVSEKSTVYSASGIKALIVGATGFILLIILLTILFSSGHMKGYDAHRGYIKKEHSTGHRLNR